MVVVGLLSNASSTASRTSRITVATITLILVILLAYDTNISRHWGPVADSLLPSHSASHVKGSVQKFLPLKVAQEICSRRRLDVYPYRDETRKVYDLFIINTELDMLEIRLEELHDQVDYFVILESRNSFVGDAKPLHLKENWNRFRPFHSQIIYKELNLTGLEFKDPWARERYHRDAMYSQVIPFLEGEQKADLDDILIVSDLDEIPQPSTVEVLRNCAIPARVTLHSDLYYYSFQWKRRSGGWIRLRATIYAGGSTILPEDLRQKPADIVLMHAAWHCSSCLPTLNDMVNKIQSFSHNEYNKPEYTDRAKILQRVRSGHDSFDRSNLIYDRVDGNRNIPGTLLKSKNQERFAYLTNRDPPSGNFQDFQERDLVLSGDPLWTPPPADIPHPD